MTNLHDDPDGTARHLVRRAHDTDPTPIEFDLVDGLADVLARAESQRAVAENAAAENTLAENAIVSRAWAGQSTVAVGGPGSMVWSDETGDDQVIGSDTGQAADPPWWELTGFQRNGACVVAARDGDRRALDALVDDLSPLVWHVARSQGITRTQAEDVVQTVWLTLLRNLGSVAEPRAVARWLITTTRREAMRAQRVGEREAPLPDEVAEELRAQDGLPEQEALRRERNSRLWTAFHRLPERCQRLLRLTVLAGRAEYAEVAEQLGMPKGSIGPTRGRCLATLHEALAEATEDDAG